VCLGVTLGLELSRPLLTVRRPVPHEVGPRAVSKLLLDDRRHATSYVSGAHQVHRRVNIDWYGTIPYGRKHQLRAHSGPFVEAVESSVSLHTVEVMGSSPVVPTGSQRPRRFGGITATVAGLWLTR
jgi:hypothetical protein